MTIAALYPDIDPSLSLDFANVKALDPRITFTRASSATYYDGKTFAKAEENLLLRSQDYSTTWTVTSLTPVTSKTAPDTTATATEFTAGASNATLTQSIVAVAADYTFSVWMRRVTGTGNVDISAHSGGTWVTQTLTSTWTRFTVTQTLTAGTRTPGIRLVTSGDAIEVWGAQLEQRSTATAYTPTTAQTITNYIPVLQTATNNVARFDHDLVSGKSLGLLIEEQRTNLLTYSEQFDDAVWTKTRSSIVANTVVAPDGTLTGDKLVEDTTASNLHFVNQSVSVTGNTTYTITCYAKAAEGNRFLRLSVFGASNWLLGYAARFNLVTGTIFSTVIGTATITAVGNGWYRCSLLVTTVASPPGDAGILVQLSDTGGNASYTGDGYSGIYIWGAQLEAGEFPTSYIKTEGSQVTRAADVASMTGTNFSSWYRQDEGTMFASFRRRFAIPNSFVFEIGDNTFNNIIAMYNDGSNIVAIVRRGGVPQVGMTLLSGYGVNNVTYRQAFAYKTNDFAGCNNAVTVLTDIGIVPTSNVTRIQVGNFLGNSQFLNGTLTKLAYYPKRLTNAQLQALTR